MRPSSFASNNNNNRKNKKKSKSSQLSKRMNRLRQNQQIMQSHIKAPRQKKVVHKQRVNTNVISIDLGTLKTAASNVATGDAFECKGCKSILSKHDELLKQYSEIKLDDEDDSIWICKFCNHINVISVDDEEIPKDETVDYILAPPSSMNEESKSNDKTESQIIFCIDISGSMCVSQQIDAKHSKFKLKGDHLGQDQDDLSQFIDANASHLNRSKSDQQYVSRLQCVQTAVNEQIETISKTNPLYKIGLVTFNNEVTVIGDGMSKHEIITGDKLKNMNKLQEIGSKCIVNNNIGAARDKLCGALWKLQETGQTALGPALVVSIAMASTIPGSQVILCTDGLANIGVGSGEFENSQNNKNKNDKNNIKKPWSMSSDGSSILSGVSHHNHTNINKTSSININKTSSTNINKISSTNINKTSNTNINKTFCWEYDSTNITITTFKPDSALNIQIKMKNSTQPLNVFTAFKHPQIITNSQSSFDNKTINSINFNLYHKISMPNTLLKISNRNFIIKRNCFKLYSICFYEINQPNPNCIDINSFATKPSDATDNTIFKDLSTTTQWTPSPDRDTGETCYEPYQEYVLFDISNIEFTSIGLGILQSISSDTIGTNMTAPRYWNFIFGDKTIIGGNYDSDILYDQYWVIDLYDSNIFTNENTINEPFFNINPLYFQLDTKPSLNRIRMDQIYFGRPEQYLIDISLYRFGQQFVGTERSMFTTWTWIGSKNAAIWDDGTPQNAYLDNQTFKIGQYAQIACKNAINYDINNTPLNTYYLSSINPTTINDQCYGTAGKYGIASGPTIQNCVIDNQIYYPPIAFWIENNNNNNLYDPPNSLIGFNEYCQKNITNVNNFAECIELPSLTKLCDGPPGGIADGQCDSVGPPLGEGAVEVAPYSWECVFENITQINTAYPTATPTITPTKTPITLSPTKPPTINPTITPTLAPYLPGTPSRAPITYTPTSDPSISPTSLTYNPSKTPTIIPSNNPTQTPNIIPTNNPIIEDEPDGTDTPDDKDTIINIYNFNIGLIEIIIAAVICCICCCLLLLLILLKSKKKKSDEESEMISQESQRTFQD
eukprot:213706_1